MISKSTLLNTCRLSAVALAATLVWPVAQAQSSSATSGAMSGMQGETCGRCSHARRHGHEGNDEG